jgi:hypothetical protein
LERRGRTDQDRVRRSGGGTMRIGFFHFFVLAGIISGMAMAYKEGNLIQIYIGMVGLTCLFAWWEGICKTHKQADKKHITADQDTINKIIKMLEDDNG